MITKYFFKKGKHTPQIPIYQRLKLLWKPEVLKFEFLFDSDCDYTLNDYDQYDWNKLTGITFSVNPHKETVMIGWRYNPNLKVIELNVYAHIDGVRYYTEPLTNVNLNSIVTGGIHVDYKTKNYQITVVKHTGSYSWNLSFSHRRILARKINPWFGGNNPAPKSMGIYLKFLK